MYCGIADIVARWVYTRQGVHQLLKSTDFPAPVFTINQGRTKVWMQADIAAYERAHPEVLDKEVKTKKINGYARVIKNGGIHPAP